MLGEIAVFEPIGQFSGVHIKAMLAPEIISDGVDISGDGTIARSDTIDIDLRLSVIDDTTGDKVPKPGMDGSVLYLVFSETLTCDPTLAKEISFPVVAGEARYSGVITDDFTFNLNEGDIYVSLFIIDVDGRKDILDMVRTKVTPCVTGMR